MRSFRWGLVLPLQRGSISGLFERRACFLARGRSDPLRIAVGAGRAVAGKENGPPTSWCLHPLPEATTLAPLADYSSIHLSNASWALVRGREDFTATCFQPNTTGRPSKIRRGWIKKEEPTDLV